MIIKNININEEYLSLRGPYESGGDCFEVPISIDQPGIYLISGANGTGKTTIMERIVFSHPSVIIEMPGHKDFKTGPGRYFAYVPQSIPASSLTIAEYLGIGNLSFDDARLLSDILLLTNTDKKTRINSLSGGERVKLCLVQAVLKDTPYLFLDEPTNNLDDKSALAVWELICALARTKAVFLITHDERLFSDLWKNSPKDRDSVNSICVNNIEIHRDRVMYTPGAVQILTGDQTGDEAPKQAAAPSYAEDLFNQSLPAAGVFLKNRINVVGFFAALLLGIAILIANLFVCMRFYAIRENHSKNTMLIYLIDNIYGEMNETYCKYSHVRVKSDIGARITYDDVPAIAESRGVRGLYALKDTMYDRIYNVLDNPDTAGVVDISIPMISEVSYAENMGFSDALILESGRPPADGAGEIALPEKTLKALIKKGAVSGADSDKADRISNNNNLIGSTVTYKGTNYKLTGITLFNFAWRSFEDGDDLLFYTYDKSTYKDFRSEMLQYKRHNRYRIIEYIDNVIIVHDEDRQKALLDWLISKYPADNYYCAEFDRVLSEAENNPLLIKMLLADLALAMVSSLILYLIYRTQYQEDRSLIRQLELFYLKRGYIQKLYLTAHLTLELISTAACIIAGFMALREYPGVPVIYTAAMIVCFAATAFPRCRAVWSARDSRNGVESDGSGIGNGAGLVSPSVRYGAGLDGYGTGNGSA